MMIDTKIDAAVESNTVADYFNTLVNKFFKILPIKEQGCETLDVYISSLQCELLGGRSFIPAFHRDDSFLTLIFILEYLVSERPDVAVVKREVFRAIGICNKLRDAYAKGVDGG